MDSVSESIGKVVALLTAMISEQEDLAYEIVKESNPIELFSALTGVMMVFINRLAKIDGLSVEDYLKDLGMFAIRSE